MERRFAANSRRTCARRVVAGATGGVASGEPQRRPRTLNTRTKLELPVDLVLRVLGIAPSTYYDGRARQAVPSRRQLDDAQLLEMIVKTRTSHEFAGTYGSPRVWLALRRQGVRCGRKRIERTDHA